MAYKVIEPENMEIFEPTQPIKKVKKPFSVNNIQVSTAELGRYLIFGFIGLALVYLGITNAGSYYIAGGRMAGSLATIFYTYQLGTVLTVTGLITIYHGFFGRK